MCGRVGRPTPIRAATVPRVKVHLIDGTYELFRQHFGMAVRHGDPAPNAAALGVVNSTLQLVQKGATHVAVASDHVIESFRNDLYPGYKSSEGMDPVLLDQIPVMEELLVAAGFTTWPMVQWEADDALGAAAAVADADERVEQVLIVTPDKDLGQCVRGTRVVQYDRRKDEIVDEDAVIAKFGVPPSSIADYLASPGCPDGERRVPRRCSPDGAPSRPSRCPVATGICRGCAAPRNWPARCSTNWPTPCCSRSSPRSRSTCRSAGSTTGAGPDPHPGSVRSPRGWAPRRWRTAPNGWRKRCHPPAEVTARWPAAHERHR
jgi:5'-3' exonuclease, N-terminal resolvase-like domain